MRTKQMITKQVITIGVGIFSNTILSLAAVDQSALPLPEIDAGALQPLVDVVRPLLIKASLLVGGIFGIYIILILVRIHYERRNMKLLQHIRYDLDQQNYHYGIPSSQEKRGFWHRLIVDRLAPAHPQKHNTVFSQKSPKLRKRKNGSTSLQNK